MNQSVKTQRRVIVFFVIFTVVMILPYWVATAAGGETHVFGGFLLNPLDGNSYLAKMREGAQGAWRFTLPFTSQPGEGAYIFLFYLFLGHLCKWTDIPLLWMFHLWRVVSVLFLLISLRKFFQFVFPDDETTSWRAFLLAGVGSGLGWLIFPTGKMLSDFWVAEAYPFLSSYANPHFPLGLGFTLWILILSVNGKVRGWLIGFLALLLGIVLPFGVVIDCMVLGGMILIDLLRHRKANFLPLALVMFFGGTMIGYQVMITQLDPVFQVWNAQNVTAAPVWWDLILSFLPALLFTTAGLVAVVKSRGQEKNLIMALWLVGAIVLICLPFNLQRRFMLGLYIPVAGLAALGCRILDRKLRISAVLLFRIVLVLSLPTNIVLILAGVFGSVSHNPAIYLTRAEDKALNWLSRQEDCLVLASPQLGMFIPGHGGCRVMYGHPFETVDAVYEEEQIEKFYNGGMLRIEAEQYLAENGIDLVIYGSRESALGRPALLDSLTPVFEDSEVTIYAVDGS
jgi:hypothetical protein